MCNLKLANTVRICLLVIPFAIQLTRLQLTNSPETHENTISKIDCTKKCIKWHSLDSMLWHSFSSWCHGVKYEVRGDV